MKRLLSLAIIASFAVSYTVPALAIEVKQDKKQAVVTRNEKIRPTQNPHRRPSGV